MCFENTKEATHEIGNYIASGVEQPGFLLKGNMILDVLGNLTFI